MNEIKLCKDCKYFDDYQAWEKGWREGLLCKYEGHIITDIDFVQGNHSYEWMDAKVDQRCDQARELNGFCGPDGKNWEKNE